MQVRVPRSPKIAATKAAPIDGLLDAGFFKALSDPTRLKILACLAKCSRPCAVGEIAECCSVDLSVVSRHLAILARAGVLESVRQGQSIRYTVRSAHLGEMLRKLADEFERHGCANGGSSNGCC